MKTITLTNKQAARIRRLILNAKIQLEVAQKHRAEHGKPEHWTDEFFEKHTNELLAKIEELKELASKME